ncbi:hypothetical protein [Sphingomonas endophytica]|uniref:Uncharacterized protein n=1 Tax=Sphingomonas endophytica TaxID=869719 RepID=A0A147I3D1_9SPHN|nr:hypothetical protein [Sphingomonas endophytica]KTT72617.1 hypothetical protein NS334_08460 [Sphingomonas endophytica]
MSDVSRSAVEDRGELSLTLAGVEMGLRPSYEAIDATEKALGRGLVDIARSALNATLTLGETAQIATEAIRAWGRDADSRDAAGATAPRIGRLILDSDQGFHGCLKTIAAMLSLAVTGGYDSAGNLKPTATTKTTDEAPVVG